MFGKKGNPKKPLSPKGKSSYLTYLASDCEINGSFTAKGDVRIDGKVEGTISVAGNLVISQTAHLKADIEAQTVCIAGEVHGNVKAKELLELSPTARLYGDINCQNLKIEQGAHFVGASTSVDTGTKSTNDSK
jgi:cytoskeletal protein CcmA (bactofilin family)